jgi:hypothetical protein
MSWIEGSGPSANALAKKKKKASTTSPGKGGSAGGPVVGGSAGGSARGTMQDKVAALRARMDAAYTIPDTVQKRTLLQSFIGESM